MALWTLTYPAVADRNFRRWYRWARSSQLEPMRKVAAMIERHWANIRTYFTHRITNAGAESLNARIQSAKRRACGFRNRDLLPLRRARPLPGTREFRCMIPATRMSEGPK